MTHSIDSHSGASRARWPRVLGRFLLPLVVLVAGVAVAVALMKTSPKVRRKPPARQARLVEVEPIRLSTQRTVVHAMGTVQAAREVELRPRVNGEIISVSPEFVPGGSFREGETLLQIDPKDFELAVHQRESDQAQAQSALALELGQQSVAQREYELLGETISNEDRDLVLRKPHLDKVRATLKAAAAALEQARLNLSRTQVKAPFNASIRARHVNVGAQVSATTALATLAGTDEYWVAATVPAEQLKWIEIPDSAGGAGSLVRVFNEAAWGRDKFRIGKVLRLLPDLEREGRMAQLLVAMHDPLALQATNAGQPQLILGAYVRIEIQGVELESVAAVDRRLVRDGNHVWILTPQNRLDVRTVDVVFRGRDQLLIRSGLEEGDHLVTTDLPAPVEGMPLRTQNEAPAPTGRPGTNATARARGN